MKLTIEEYKNEEIKDHESNMAWLEKYARLLPIALEHAREFGELTYSTSERYAFVYLTPKLTMHLNVYLATDDTIKDIYPALDKMIKDPRLEMTSPLGKRPYGDNSYVTCNFRERLPQEENPQQLTVYIHIDRVSTCKRVGTGKFQEIMETVCSDEAS